MSTDDPGSSASTEAYLAGHLALLEGREKKGYNKVRTDGSHQLRNGFLAGEIFADQGQIVSQPDDVTKFRRRLSRIFT